VGDVKNTNGYGKEDAAQSSHGHGEKNAWIAFVCRDSKGSDTMTLRAVDHDVFHRSTSATAVSRMLGLSLALARVGRQRQRRRTRSCSSLEEEARAVVPVEALVRQRELFCA
jgi:hypothetical protein